MECKSVEVQTEEEDGYYLTQDEIAKLCQRFSDAKIAEAVGQVKDEVDKRMLAREAQMGRMQCPKAAA